MIVITVVGVGKRVVEVQILGNDQSRARYEVSDNERVGDIVRRYLQEHDPSLLNSQHGYQIAAFDPSGNRVAIDSNMTVRDLITKYGTDTISITPGALFGK